MFCSNCGERLNDNAIFCQKCGTQVRTSEKLQGVRQSTQPTLRQEEEPKTKGQKSKKQRKASVGLLGVLSLLTMAVAIVLYIGVWLSWLNQPNTTVRDWPVIILNGIFIIVWLVLVSAVVIKPRDLVHKKILWICTLLYVLNILVGIAITISRIISWVQSWIRAQSDPYFTVKDAEKAVLMYGLSVVVSILVIVACILTLYAVKKQRKRLLKVLLVLWVISISYQLIYIVINYRLYKGYYYKNTFWDDWLCITEYFRTLYSQLIPTSGSLFWLWLILKSKQQARN